MLLEENTEYKIGLKDLYNILHVNQNTIRVYLSGWTLSKYYIGKRFLICKDSINRMYTFLINRQNRNAANKWKRYFPQADYIENIEEKI